MARKISDKDRVISFFTMAAPADVTALLETVNMIARARGIGVVKRERKKKDDAAKTGDAGKAAGEKKEGGKKGATGKAPAADAEAGKTADSPSAAAASS